MIEVTVRARVRELPPDHFGGSDLKTVDLTGIGPTYAQARAHVDEQVPAGWGVLFYEVDR